MKHEWLQQQKSAQEMSEDNKVSLAATKFK